MQILGAHMSIAGGYYKAVEAAASFGMSTCQLFTKNNNQWNAKPLSTQDLEDFKVCLKQTGITHPVAHDSYLINLASPNDELWKKSIEAFKHELERAEALGLIGVVMHPGAYVSSTPEAGLQRIVEALDDIHAATAGYQTLTLLETTAGQGSTLGAKFEELAWIIDHAATPERLGVCVDTCHIFSAGYPLIAAAEYAATFAEFDRLIGVSRIKAFHLNDSLKPFASRVDRHAHIGRGSLGLEPFRHLLNDPRFAKVPMYLETAKGEEDGEQLDAINLRTLQSLIQPAAKKRAAK
ncbi:MAG: Endonuclease [Planctomycetaceae bacterium]|nr:Endonuclease [Planctomycetaceae bacterium]